LNGTSAPGSAPTTSRFRIAPTCRGAREKCFGSREKGYLVNPVVYVCHRGSSALRPSSVSHLDFGDTPADRIPSRAPRSASAAAAR
jgi:hypothetical protein